MSTGKAAFVRALTVSTLTLDIMDHQTGGLGIHFIRTLSDSVSYRRENDRNILRMEFRSILEGLQ